MHVFKHNVMEAGSSAGQSAPLIRVRSEVQVFFGLPTLILLCKSNDSEAVFDCLQSMTFGQTILRDKCSRHLLRNCLPHFSSRISMKCQRGFSSVGRASALQAEGQRFESAKLHHLNSTSFVLDIGLLAKVLSRYLTSYKEGSSAQRQITLDLLFSTRMGFKQ